jgi:O-antigen/teichoic acid export membrane protein
MDFWPWGFFSVLTGFFNAYFKAASICLIYLKKPGTFLISNLVNFFVTVLISVGGLFLFPDSILGPMYGRLISGGVIFLIGLGVFRQNSIWVFDKEFLNDLFKFCVPYVFYVISGWVLMQVDRYVLQAYIPNTELNAYDLLLKCFYGVEFIQNSLSAVIYPKVYELWAKQEKKGTTPESNRYFNVLTAINILQLIAFCIAIPWVYRLFVDNPVFFQGEAYIGILAAGYALRSILSFYLAGILFTGNVLVLLRVFGLSALIQILLTWPASHYYGLNGAILAGLITKLVQVLLCRWLASKVFHYDYNVYKILALPFSFLLINSIQYYMQPEYTAWFYMVELIGFGILIYALFSKEIRKVLGNFAWPGGN